ncbi:hypothetical protein SAMN05216570_3854 [Dyella sp. OK004]|uniref:hypothetical protein n=1 Tax=Dyella sp. OK004 TaxID=1855292 RepID=UPI0008F445E8|nr:hypothetical protein [Dyella sp. OK004]SFS18931.1 hypothetical protein SAMN05216570_3854 [Dyella sp. OK004]
MSESISTARRKVMLDGLVCASALSLLPITSALAAHTKTPSEAWAPPGATIPTGDIHDFDFFVGHWDFVNRRLKKRWVDSDDWDTFPASLVCANHLGGVVNIDEGVFPTKGWSGMTVRIFDRTKRQWSLYWINSSTGVLYPPVVGGFNGDHGVFYGDDHDDDMPVKIRFLWTRLGHDKAHWEQAFSKDNGKTWETNWLIDHTRAAA